MRELKIFTRLKSAFSDKKTAWWFDEKKNI